MAEMEGSWLPGESAYSVVARAYLSSPYASWKRTNQASFGHQEVRIHPMLPGHLPAIAALARTSIAELRLRASGHVLVSFGLLTPDRRVKLMQSESALNASKVIEHGRLAAAKVSFGHQLKCCPRCVELDEDNHGVAYWHTVHQLPGVLVCPEHGLVLNSVSCGDGGVNHQYVLPSNNLMHENGRDKAIYLSQYISSLYALLCQYSPLFDMARLYQGWLEHKQLLSQCHRIRWRELRRQLNQFWGELFAPLNSGLPADLMRFQYVPRLVHQNCPTHYIRHVLIMAFLTDTPTAFFNGPPSKQNAAPFKPSDCVDEIKVLALLDKGLSMRQVSVQLQYSLGTIKGIALRHQRLIGRRRQKITPQIERDIWRKV